MRLPGIALVRRRNDSSDDEDDLVALARAWSPYDIARQGRTWAAACRHGIPVLLTAPTADGLGALIAADWTRRTV